MRVAFTSLNDYATSHYLVKNTNRFSLNFRQLGHSP